MVLLLRTLQASDAEHKSNGQHTWLDLQRKLRSSGMNISYDTFKNRWDSQQPSDQILKSLVDRFDGHGLVMKNTDGQELAQGQGNKPSEVSKMAKRATKLGK